MRGYRAPWWLPGGQTQTLWPALVSRPRFASLPRYARERWRSPDGDFIDVDHVAAAAGAPWLVLFHGLESSSTSRYAVAFAHVARARGWHFIVPHFRGCSGALNLAPRSYHSGDFDELGWVLGRIRETAGAPLLAAGVSLGGNALLRWAEEAGSSAAAVVRAVAAVCAPVDLTTAGAAIDRGINRLIYARMFLATMKPRALAKWQQYPRLFDRERLIAARTLHAFDDCFTAPLHGFASVDDYWRRASSKPHLDTIRVPTLLLNARNDPLVPDASLPRPHEVGAHVTLWQPHDGGHVGFVAGRFPGHVRTMPEAVCDWLADGG
jgi:predicted alpha/beta-fold hydrolase